MPRDLQKPEIRDAIPRIQQLILEGKNKEAHRALRRLNAKDRFFNLSPAREFFNKVYSFPTP